MRSDNRKLSHDVLEEIRIRSVKMVVKSWMRNKEVCEIMEVWVQMLSVWLGKYREWGWKALKSKKNPWGRPRVQEKNLTWPEKRQLEKFLLQTPRDIKQLQLDVSLWNAKIVGELIEKIFFKSLKEGQVRKVLKELGFSHQKPIFRAYQQNLEKVEEWKTTLRPQIEQEAKVEEREVLYGDEAWFKSTDHKGMTWWKKWITPIVKATWARFGINAISAISKNWVMKFMAYEWSFTSDTLILFLDKLIYKTDKKFTLILDGHPTHKTKKVQEWLASHTIHVPGTGSGTGSGTTIPQVRLYHLPPYSPELNPDEQVWKHTKHELKWRIVRSTKEIRTVVSNALFRIQKKKELISSFFKHPEFL